MHIIYEDNWHHHPNDYKVKCWISLILTQRIDVTIMFFIYFLDQTKQEDLFFSQKPIPRFPFAVFSMSNHRCPKLTFWESQLQSITYNITPSTQWHFKQLCGSGDVVCELTEPPAVEGNLTPPVQLPYHSVQRKKVFWTWLEEMFISSNMRGDISLLNVYCGATMIEVCLCSKKICDSMGFRAANRLRVDYTSVHYRNHIWIAYLRQGPDRWLFFCVDRGQITTAKKPD